MADSIPQAADAKVLNEALNALAVNIVSVRRGLEDLAKPTKDFAQQANNILGDFKDTVTILDHNHDKLKAMSSTLRNFSKISLFKGETDGKKVAESLEKINEEMLALQKNSKLTAKESEIFTATLKQNVKFLDELNEAGKDTEKIAKVLEKVAQASRDTGAAVKELTEEAKDATEEFENLGNQDFSRQRHSIKSLSTEFGSLFKNIAMGSHLSFAGIGAIIKQVGSLKTLAKATAGEMVKDWQRAGSIASKFKTADTFAPDGTKIRGKKIDKTAASAFFKHLSEGKQVGPGIFKDLNSVDKEKLISQLAGGSGLSGWASKKVLKSVANTAVGEAVTAVGSQAVGIGGGSIIRGVMSSIGQAIVANPVGATIVAGLALAGGGALMAGKIGADMNKKLVEELGKGGVAGGANPYETLQDLKKGLTPSTFGTLAGIHGMNYEKNMGIMKSVTESGWATPNMQGFDAGEALTSKKMDFKTGIMKNAYRYGKMSGLNEDESTKLTIKGIETFHLSMQGVEDMFIKLNKATQSAGISTTAYLNLIDSVTGSFDSWNKSLNQTLDVMDALGKSGKTTASGMKDMLETLMGKEKDLVTNAFLFTISPQARAGARRSADATAKASQKDMAGISGWSVEDIQKSLTLLEKGEGGEFERLRTQVTETGDAATDKVNSGKLQQMVQQSQSAKKLSRAGGLGFAAEMDAGGADNPGSRMASNTAAMRTSLGQGGISDILSGKNTTLLGAGLQHLLKTDAKGTISNMRPIVSALFDTLKKDPERAHELGFETENGHLKAQSADALAKENGGETLWSLLAGLPADMAKDIEPFMRENADQTVDQLLKAQWSKVEAALTISNRLLDEIKLNTGLMAEDKKVAKKEEQERADRAKFTAALNPFQSINWSAEAGEKGQTIAKYENTQDLVEFKDRAANSLKEDKADARLRDLPPAQIAAYTKMQELGSELLTKVQGQDISKPLGERVLQAQRLNQYGVNSSQSILSPKDLADPKITGQWIEMFEKALKEADAIKGKTPGDKSSPPKPGLESIPLISKIPNPEGTVRGAGFSNGPAAANKITATNLSYFNTTPPQSLTQDIASFAPTQASQAADGSSLIYAQKTEVHVPILTGGR